MDLITNARARINLPNAAAADDAAINTLIAAASGAIRRYCRRDFTATAYDELLDGSGAGRLALRHFPIVSVQAVRHRPAAVLTVQNVNVALNQQARVTVTAIGLTLLRVASGVPSTDLVPFAGNVTLNALAAAVNAVGNGWSAQVAGGFGLWPTADLRGPQGALNACGQGAALQLHTAELAGYQVDERRGWLLCGVWPVGVGNFRVQYTAGYSAVPDDVQEACAALTATWFQQRGRDLSLSAENVAGTYSYATAGVERLPPRVRALLHPYVDHRV